MSNAPNAVFLDTSIFDGQQYNFDSRKLADFTKLCKQMRLELLMPHPTELEIRRHIKERADFAIKAIRDAIAQAPFLRKWKGFPEDRFIADDQAARIMLGKAAGFEYRKFLKNFDVVHLDYENIDVAGVMQDYDRCRPPFAEGKKRKEFPDAFAIAILSAHATMKDKHVAVVSSDADFESACGEHTRLLYFKSLEEVTASLLRDSDPERVLRFHAAIEGAIAKFNGTLVEPLRWMLHYIHYQNITVESSIADKIHLNGFRVIAIGKDECTVSFESVIEARHKVSWPDPHNPSQRNVGVIEEASQVQGTAKASFKSHVKTVDKKKTWELEYKSVGAIEFDNYGAVVLNALPSNYEHPPGLLGGLASLLADDRTRFPAGGATAPDGKFNPYLLTKDIGTA
jgi:hypothetical protein